MKIKFILAALLLFALPGLAAADVTKSITITGNQRVDVESVKSYLTFHEGAEVDDAEINQSVKALFATNLFSDVKIANNAGNVTVIVVENPIISRVAFEGNKTLNDEKLEGEVSLKSRSIYTKAAVQTDVQRIVDLYRKNGRYNATVEPKVILKDQNRVDLIFEIKENEATVIKEIEFIGNRSFTDKALRGVVQSAETRWYNFFSDDDKFDSDRLEYDKELLRRFYTKNGFADFKVNSGVAELTPDRDGFILSFTVDEGARYKFGKIQVVTQLADLKPEQLKDSEDTITTKEGKMYDSSRVEKTVDNLTEKAGQKGFAFVEIDPQMSRDKEKHIIDITYVIKEGPKVYVDKINIHGNTRTLDSVIRREFRIAEGDPFNTDAIKRSKQRIENLGYFKKVDVQQQKADEPDKVDLDVGVEEKSTGSLNFGAGYSTLDGILGEASLSEKNFLGRGQQVSLSLSASQRRQDADFSFTEPYFMDKDLAAGFDLFSTSTEDEYQSSYKSRSTGVNLRTGYDINEHLRHNINYKISLDNVSDVSADASAYIRDQEGKTTTSLIGHNLVYDQRDNKNDPARGYIIKGEQDFAGLGGDVRFVKHEVNAGYYLSLDDNKDYRMMFMGNAGNITGIGKDVPINQRYFIGGENLRGFERGGIGPRDTSTGDSLGGDDYYTVTTEFGFPLGLPEELGFRGALFIDAGSLWNTDASGPNIYDDPSLRVSAGAGVSWASPFGPIRIDFGIPIVKNTNDKTEIFQLNFGTRF